VTHLMWIIGCIWLFLLLSVSIVFFDGLSRVFAIPFPPFSHLLPLPILFSAPGQFHRSSSLLVGAGEVSILHLTCLLLRGSRGHSFSFRTAVVVILIASFVLIGDREERYCSLALFCSLGSSSRSNIF
jgi:hypothetical protein